MTADHPSALAATPEAPAPDGSLPSDAARLTKIAELALALTPLLDAERILTTAAAHLGGALRGARGYLLVWQREPAPALLQAYVGRPAPAPLAADAASLLRGLCAEALAAGEVRVAAAGEVRAAAAPWEWALLAERGAVLLAAPLPAGPWARAALLLSADEPPDDEDMRLLDAACAAVGGALARSWDHRTAQNERLAGMVRLTAAIAHEVNNPLQAISNSLHLLLSRTLSEDKRTRYLSMAQKEVEQLIGVVRRMLDFSRPPRDGMRPVALHAALESVLTATAEDFQERGITVRREWAEGLPRVSGVASHLKQALMSLVVAARDSMPAGGVLRVRTSTAPREGGGGDLVVVELIDSGARMPEEELDAIFEPFAQTRRDASGMGLPMSYTIVAQHGGRLSVTTADAGTTFRIELPALGLPR